MKLTVDRKSFFASFVMASGFISPRSPREILKSLLLTAGDETTLMANDLEHGAIVRAAHSRVDEPGVAILSASEVRAIFENGTDQELVIETVGPNISIRGEHSEFELPAQDPDLFPANPDFPSSGYYIATARDFKTMVKRTVYATTGEMQSYGMSCCVLEFGDGVLTMAATNVGALGRMVCPMETEGDVSATNQRPLVPGRSLKRIAAHLEDDDPPVHFVANKSDFLIRTEDATIYARLSEGRFPQYQFGFADPIVNSVQVKSGELMSAIRLAASVVAIDTKAVEFRFEPGVLSLGVVRSKGGRSRVRMPIAYEGDLVSVALSPDNVLEPLKALGDNADVIVSLADCRRGVTFSSEGGYTFAAQIVAPRPA